MAERVGQGPVREIMKAGCGRQIGSLGHLGLHRLGLGPGGKRHFPSARFCVTTNSWCRQFVLPKNQKVAPRPPGRALRSACAGRLRNSSRSTFGAASRTIYPRGRPQSGDWWCLG
jgi:hypothetical protein